MHPGAVLPPAGVLQPPGVGCRGWPRGAPAPCSRCCLPLSHRARAESTAQQYPRLGSAPPVQAQTQSVASTQVDKPTHRRSS